MDKNYCHTCGKWKRLFGGYCRKCIDAYRNSYQPERGLQ